MTHRIRNTVARRRARSRSTTRSSRSFEGTNTHTNVIDDTKVVSLSSPSSAQFRSNCNATGSESFCCSSPTESFCLPTSENSDTGVVSQYTLPKPCSFNAASPESSSVTSSNFQSNVPCVHSNLPLSRDRGYTRTTLAWIVPSILLYLCVLSYMALAEDISFAIQKQSEIVQHEAMLCASEYQTNLCATEYVPAMVPRCAKWKLCMTANPTLVFRTIVVSKHLAALLESFMEDLGPASLGFVVMVIVCVTYAFSRQ